MIKLIETFRASGNFSPELIDELKKAVKQISVKKELLFKEQATYI